MNRKAYIFINGILSNPGDENGWTDRAESWIEANTEDTATRHEYCCGVVTRRFFQNERVRKLENVAKRYLGDKLVLVGHSNGCDIIERFVRRGVYPCHEIHLIAAASEHDFEANGLNEALKKNKVGKVYVYWSPNDSVLKQARWTRGILKYVGLGYGHLGLVGPFNVNKDVIDRVHNIQWGCNHSQWVDKSQGFDKLMQLISSPRI